jgi:hypothetical protein
MRKPGMLFILAIIPFIFVISSCLTTGDRINMDEFNRQLEAGGQGEGVTRTAEALSTTENAAAAANTAAAAEGITGTAVAAAVTPVTQAAAVAEEKTGVPVEKATAEEATAIPTKAPVKEPKPAATAITMKAKAVKITAAPTAITVKAKAVKIAAVAAPVKKEPSAAETKTGGGNSNWAFIFIFAAALAVFALVAFILTRKKQEKEEALPPQPGPQAEAIEPEKAAEEYKAAAELKPEPPAPEPQPQAGQEPEPVPEPQPPAEQQAEPVPEEKPEETAAPAEGPAAEKEYVHPEDASARQAQIAAMQAPGAPVAQPETPPALVPQTGEGIAGISPTQFTAGSKGNAVHILYKVGGDSPEYRTIRITVPEGWSRPSTVNTDEGYFTASLNSGRIISTAAEKMFMIVTVYGLAADTGEVAITYGERRGGGPGATAQEQTGQTVFKIETEGRGSGELKEIEDSPVVEIN